jgi:hypothetical protein
MKQWPFQLVLKHDAITWTCVLVGLIAAFLWPDMVIGKRSAFLKNHASKTVILFG